MPPPGLRYHAFISHAPADDHEPGREWAEWLSAAIEDFEVPAAMAGRPTPAGPVPRSLVPVFCEARTLGREGELDPVSRDALEQSRVLVVVCSPHAAQSPEVAEEIRYFKSIGRERILAFIVAGEPGASDEPTVRPEAECLPEPLRFDVRRDGTLDREWRVHPVSADVRIEGGREGCTSGAALREMLMKNGVPQHEAQTRAADFEAILEAAKRKIVAGILGVPLPDLMRRLGPLVREPARLSGPPGPSPRLRPGEVPDEVDRLGRRLPAGPPPPRRSRVGLIFALLLLLLAGGAGWLAWKAQQAQKDAEEAKHRADTLLAWIQRDLSEKLATTNNLPLMTDVNERLKQYFQFALSQGSDVTLQPALTDAVSIAAEIALARAAYGQAVEYARQAIQLREKAIAAGSSADEPEVHLVEDNRRLTRALDKAGRKPEALTQAEATQGKVNRLLEKRGNDMLLLRHSVMADYEAGELLLEAARADEAQKNFASGLATAKRLQAMDTGNLQFQQDVAEGAEKLGDVRQRKNDAAGALEQYRAAQKILEPLATANPELAQVQSAMAVVRTRVGGLLTLQRDFPEAAEEYRRAVEIEEALAAKQPTNIECQIEYANGLRRLAECLLQQGAEYRLEALTLLQRAGDHVAHRISDQDNPKVMAVRTEIERVKLEAMK